jgi:hypothetical protein
MSSAKKIYGSKKKKIFSKIEEKTLIVVKNNQN